MLFIKYCREPGDICEYFEYRRKSTSTTNSQADVGASLRGHPALELRHKELGSGLPTQTDKREGRGEASIRRWGTWLELAMTRARLVYLTIRELVYRRIYNKGAGSLVGALTFVP